MDFVACKEDVISWENLQKILPEACKTFDRVLQNAGTCLEEVARARNNDDWEEIKSAKKIQNQLEKFMEAFKEFTTDPKTKKFLEIDLGYHDLDNGSKYDEISGGFFVVYGHKNWTPLGKKFQKFIDPVSYCVYG
jgi:hypothetical protein